jgi:hypothetical protein
LPGDAGRRRPHSSLTMIVFVAVAWHSVLRPVVRDGGGPAGGLPPATITGFAQGGNSMTDPNMPLPAVPQQPGQHVQPAQYAPPGQPAQYTQPGQYAQPVQTAPYGGAGQPVRRTGMKRSAWGVWWLSYLTLGIYYLVWYYKVNEELSQFAPHAVRVNSGLAVLSQFVPIVSWVSLAHTANRLNAAAASIGSPVHVSGGMTVLSSFWFGSQTRYLQRRLNTLWDTASTLHANTHAG